jgi:Ca-activated chloride channel family protein
MLFLLALVLGYYWWKRRSKTASLHFSSTRALKAAPGTLRSRLLHLPLLLKALGIIFLIIALARPQESSIMTKRNVEGIDIMIVLDVSDSMLIEDMKPLNRLEAAKETIANFVKARSSDRIGIVIFAGESFTLVPLTLDYELLLSRIAEITTARQARIKDGTAIGVATANGAGRLRESTAKSRVMIFLTDGENNSGTIDPETGLDIAKGYGIKIYSIGLGKDGPTRIPVFTNDVMGRPIKTYQPFESTVNDDLLGRMGSETGGKYFRATREDSLAGVFSSIDSLEKTKVEENKFTRYEELFKSWLVWAILAYLAGWLLSQTWLRRMP